MYLACMKWLLILGILLAVVGVQAQHLETTNPANEKKSKFYAGDAVFFKKETSKKVLKGILMGFREDSIILSTDSFPLTQLEDIIHQRPLGELGFTLLSFYELFGSFIQYGVGGYIYFSYTTYAFLSGDSLGPPMVLTAVAFGLGAALKWQGRILKRAAFTSGKKKDINLVF